MCEVVVVGGGVVNLYTELKEKGGFGQEVHAQF